MSFWHPFRHSSFGVVASLQVAENPIDASAALEPFDQPANPYKWSFRKSYWSSGVILAGLYFQRSLTRRVDLRINAEGGAALCYFLAK